MLGEGCVWGGPSRVGLPALSHLLCGLGQSNSTLISGFSPARGGRGPSRQPRGHLSEMTPGDLRTVARYPLLFVVLAAPMGGKATLSFKPREASSPRGLLAAPRQSWCLSCRVPREGVKFGVCVATFPRRGETETGCGRWAPIPGNKGWGWISKVPPAGGSQATS